MRHGLNRHRYETLLKDDPPRKSSFSAETSLERSPLIATAFCFWHGDRRHSAGPETETSTNCKKGVRHWLCGVYDQPPASPSWLSKGPTLTATTDRPGKGRPQPPFFDGFFSFSRSGPTCPKQQLRRRKPCLPGTPWHQPFKFFFFGTKIQRGLGPRGERHDGKGRLHLGPRPPPNSPDDRRRPAPRARCDPPSSYAGVHVKVERRGKPRPGSI